MKSEETNSPAYINWGKLVKFFSAFELLKAKGPLTPEQQKEYDDTFEFMKKEAISKLQNVAAPLNPIVAEIKDEQKDIDAARAAIPVSTFKPIGTPPVGAADPASQVWLTLQLTEQ